jgi:hypothetical protein
LRPLVRYAEPQLRQRASELRGAPRREQARCAHRLVSRPSVDAARREPGRAEGAACSRQRATESARAAVTPLPRNTAVTRRRTAAAHTVVRPRRDSPAARESAARRSGRGGRGGRGALPATAPWPHTTSCSAPARAPPTGAARAQLLRGAAAAPLPTSAADCCSPCKRRQAATVVGPTQPQKNVRQYVRPTAISGAQRTTLQKRRPEARQEARRTQNISSRGQTGVPTRRDSWTAWCPPDPTRPLRVVALRVVTSSQTC